MSAGRLCALSVLAVVALSTLIRIPVLRWPVAEHPDWLCCGHPDEIERYDLIRAFRSGSDPGSYPPGLPFLTWAAVQSPVGHLASLVASARAPEDQRERIRVVLTARILCLLFSGLAVVLLFLVCLEARLSPWLAAASAPLLALAPLYTVQTTYGLADTPHLALVLAAVYAFLKWDRGRKLLPEVLFGFFLGGAFAFKLVGITIGIPPLISMIVRAGSRVRTSAAVGLSFVAGAWVLSGGFLRFASISSMFQKVVVENAQASRITPGWNAVHHALSLLPGLGLFFATLLVVSVVSRLIASAREGRSPARSTLLQPFPAIGVGVFLYFAGICFSSNPFTRHMLPVYPFLILFVLKTIDAIAADRFSPALRQRLPVFVFASALVYNTFASWPVVRSFARDPVGRATAWVRAETGYEPRVPALRNFPPIASVRANSPSSVGDSLVIVHSAWLGRLTANWWLKPAPRDTRDVYHFEGSLGELRFWQKLLVGRSRDWRVIASFGDDWNTPERFFLSLLGRGYDQFVTAGRVYVVARGTGVRNDRRAVGGR
jgi:hypothetical protein